MTAMYSHILPEALAQVGTWSRHRQLPTLRREDGEQPLLSAASLATVHTKLGALSEMTNTFAKSWLLVASTSWTPARTCDEGTCSVALGLRIGERALGGASWRPGGESAVLLLFCYGSLCCSGWTGVFGALQRIAWWVVEMVTLGHEEMDTCLVLRDFVIKSRRMCGGSIPTPCCPRNATGSIRACVP